MDPSELEVLNAVTDYLHTAFRIDLLLPLRSLVFKEESGYKTFYFHLLKPQV